MNLIGNKTVAPASEPSLFDRLFPLADSHTISVKIIEIVQYTLPLYQMFGGEKVILGDYKEISVKVMDTEGNTYTFLRRTERKDYPYKEGDSLSLHLGYRRLIGSLYGKEKTLLD